MVPATLTDTHGIVALAAAAVAVVALIACAALLLSVRRLRRDQRRVLGSEGEGDVVAHASAMQDAFEALRGYVDDVAVRLDERLAGAETALRGTISHCALVRYDAYNELSGQQSVSIAPLENSLDGSVSVTLDLLAGGASELEIVAEALLLVRHSLIAAAPVELSEIDTVLSHPQVPGQCERFLRSELAHARIVPAASTAEAVRIVAGRPQRGQAALGTALAARIYGGTVIREGGQDSDENAKRLVWLPRAGHGGDAPLDASARGGRKTSLLFWG